MSNLIDLLRERIDNDRPDDVKRAIAEGIAAYLDNHDVLSSKELRTAHGLLQNEGVISRTAPFEVYCTANNKWIKDSDRFSRVKFLDAVKKILAERYSDSCEATIIYVNNNGDKPRDAHFENIKLFYKDEKVLRKYLGERISDEPVKVVHSFRID